ncbi:hypothetical protein E4U17_004775 [Claviceps sp. LM77 group G4]|nr:hypothetical protein E4U17_004775 [Claviceps sp. LM77 group G4]KAG6076245.1 hypothetical protein E4U33_001890 [Claviceps sp. LM78 group G4]KAG6085558.1 hypothetical protein E4U16_004449 [Claviceps sp. LM84 group G4]
MDGRWTSRCDENQDDNRRLPGANFGQLLPGASPPYYPFPQDLDEAQLSHLAASSSTDHPGNLSHTGRNVHGSASISDINATIHNAFDTNRGGYHHLQDEPTLSGNPAASSHSSLDNNDPSVKPDVPIPIQSAADVVLKMYQSVRIDSTLCKKLAEEVARREPVQRRSDQKLNIRRRSNVEALLAHVTGEVAPRSCKNCRRGHGPWTQCVVYEGQMCGSCTNCWFNASGSRCTFHESNNPQHSLYNPTGPPAPVPPGAMLSYPQHPILPSSSPSVIAAYQNGDIAQWGMGDPARNMVNSVMGEAMALSKKDRFLVRIEAAAKELGMRMAEFDEFLQTPEGLVEQQREQRYHLAQQSHSRDASMREDSSGSPLA